MEDVGKTGELVFKFKTKTKSTIFLLAVFVLAPFVFSRPELYSSFPYYFFLVIPLIVFLSTFTKRYVLNDEQIKLMSAFKISDKTFRWDRVNEASIFKFNNVSQGSDSVQMMQPFAVIRSFASRGPQYGLRIFVNSGAQPMTILPGEIERFDELYNFVDEKVKIRRS